MWWTGARIWLGQSLGLSWTLPVGLLAVACLNCAGAEASSQKTNLSIGLLLPRDEAQPASITNGLLLAVHQANAKGSPHVDCFIRGAVGQWGADGVEAARMVADDRAEGLIAPPNGAGSHLTLQVSGRTATPVVSLCQDSSVTKTGVPWMVRISPTTVDEARALLIDLAGRTNCHWIVLVPTGRPGREIGQDMSRSAEMTGLPAPIILQVPGPNPSVQTLSRAVLTNSPQFVLVWLEPQTAGCMVKTLRDQGFKGGLAGPGWLRCAEFFSVAGARAGDIEVALPRLTAAEQQRFQEFAQAFRSRWKREPDPTAALSYDAAQLLIWILGEAGGRPPHEMFPLRASFSGATGELRFDAEGNRIVQMEVIKLGQAATPVR